MRQITQNQLQEMPVTTAPGEIWLLIDLHRVENMTTAEVFRLAESVGFPVQELRYRAQSDGLALYAILHYEQRHPDSLLEMPYLTDEAFEELSHRIQPDTAVHFRYRLKSGMETEAA